jgi:tRNA (mo5U34)-methyltransferase
MSDVHELRREVAAIRWFHTIDLGDGVVTPGEDASPEKLRRIHLPPDLSGKTVLDVGAWDGFYSFEAERRGAERVVAIDPNAWRAPVGAGNPWSGRQGFDLARRALGSKVEDVDIGLEELAPERIGTFDVVLFLGVLYHLPDPLPVLERVSALARELLILETQVDLMWTRRPAMAHYPGSELLGDASNWWGPNPPLVEALLRAHGFTRVIQVHRESLPYRAARSLYRRLRGERFLVQQGRLVVHAMR